jgi:integrase/recombinase XerD
VVARRAHNPEVVGSNPTPATNPENENVQPEKLDISLFTLPPEQSYNDIVMASKTDDSNLQSVLTALQKLSPADRQAVIQALQGGPSNQIEKPANGVPDWQSELKLRGLAEGTIELYSRTVRKLIEQYPVPTNREVRAYLAERLKVVTPTKVRNDQKALRSFFNFLEEQGLWVTNPTKGMKLMRVAKVIRKAPPQEDVQRLLAAWQGSDQRLRDRLLIAIFVNTGLRITEACSILRENLDLEECKIKVMGKGRKERTVYFSPAVGDLLREYITTKCRTGKYLFPADNKLGYQGIRSLEKTFRRLCKRLGIKPITPHMLRHYFATHALKNGARIEVISRLLGHASVAITDQVYVHIGEQEAEDEARKYAPLSKEE